MTYFKSLKEPLNGSCLCTSPYGIPAKRDRYAALLGMPNKRAKILDGLNHCHDFDARYTTALPSTADVQALLRSQGAGASCHVISDCPEIDKKQMALEEAVSNAEASGAAYYLGESGEQRLLLRRSTF